MTLSENKKVVLITGVTKGFGTHLARAFADADYELVLHGRREEELLDLKSSLKKEGLSCAITVSDLCAESGISTLKNAIRNYSVNTLINNAAINPELNTNPATSFEDVKSIFDVNASATIALNFAAFEEFSVTSKHVRTILNVNSVAGLKGSEKEPVYAASKAALRGFSESVKEAWLKCGVRVIDVYSGAIATGMSAHRHDIDSLIDPRELAEYIVSLCETKSFLVRDVSVQRARK